MKKKKEKRRKITVECGKRPEKCNFLGFKFKNISEKTMDSDPDDPTPMEEDVVVPSPPAPIQTTNKFIHEVI